jgi:glycosyltransferase involved in cell wall biosynthesis
VSAVRVVMATANYLPVMGGVETHVAEVAPRLHELGFDIVVVTTDVGGTLPRSAVIDGVPVVRVPAWRATGDLHVAPGLLDAIRQERPRIVHVQGYHTLVPPGAMVAARAAAARWVVTFHSGGHASGLRNRLRRLQVLAQRPLLTRASALIAVSEFEATLFSRWLRVPRARITVVPNGTRPLPPVAGPTDTAPLILSIGRLEPYKGHDRAIAAMPSVLEHEPSARLRILGRGPDGDRLRSEASRLGVGDRVEIDAIPGGDAAGMAAALAHAHVVVALSDYESQGLAALEAVAAGRRVVVADRTALHEIVDRGWARGVVDPADSTRVSAAIVAELRQPVPVAVPDRLPTWDECALRLADIYRRTAGVAP